MRQRGHSFYHFTDFVLAEIYREEKKQQKKKKKEM